MSSTHRGLSIITCLTLLLCGGWVVAGDCNGNGIPDDQELIVDGSMWASSVLGYSSQWSDTAWSAFQALGEPDTPTYGDTNTAWATACADDGGGLG
jgi:hypothetical protein